MYYRFKWQLLRIKFVMTAIFISSYEEMKESRNEKRKGLYYDIFVGRK